jgi:cellulose synthase/poly-beta-1,6-N-acetylglucosamine synthase-like glycosyltransferase
MKISVVVPVYRAPKGMDDIINKILASNYENKEIIIVVDGDLTPEISEAIEPFKGKISIKYSGKHLGKARALNQAVRSLSTDIILFLDNDILLPDNPLFLSILSTEMKTNDIVEMPKDVIAESLFSAMISYEYLSIAMACLTFSIFAKKSPSIIGAAFAVKKELFDRLGGFKYVIDEDIDFGARAFRMHARYSYCLDLKVKVTMPNTFPDWLKQRKRWTLNNVLWFKDNFLYLFLRVFKQPSLFITLIIIILPTAISSLLLIIFNQLHLPFVIPVFFMVAQPFQLPIGLLIWFSHYAMISQGILSISLGLMISEFIFYFCSLFIKFRFNIFDYIIYYFLYFPALVIANLVMFILLIGKKNIELDWKV